MDRYGILLKKKRPVKKALKKVSVPIGSKKKAKKKDRNRGRAWGEKPAKQRPCNEARSTKPCLKGPIHWPPFELLYILAIFLYPPLMRVLDGQL